MDIVNLMKLQNFDYTTISVFWIVAVIQPKSLFLEASGCQRLRVIMD